MLISYIELFQDSVRNIQAYTVHIACVCVYAADIAFAKLKQGLRLRLATWWEERKSGRDRVRVFGTK